MGNVPYPYGRHPSTYKTVPVFHDDATGTVWITERDLDEAGYDFGPRECEAIVYLNGDWYEIMGYSRQARSFWIRHIDPDSEFADLPVLEEDAGYPGEEMGAPSS